MIARWIRLAGLSVALSLLAGLAGCEIKYHPPAAQTQASQQQAQPLPQPGAPPPPPIPMPAVQRAPEDAVRKLRELLRAGKSEEALGLMHVGSSGLDSARARWHNISQSLTSGQADFAPLESHQRGHCAVVVVNESRKRGLPSFDLDPFYLVIVDQDWRILAKPTDFEHPAYDLDGSQLDDLKLLKQWFDARKAELTAARKKAGNPARNKPPARSPAMPGPRRLEP